MYFILGPYEMDALHSSFFDAMTDYYAELRRELASAGGHRGVLPLSELTCIPLRAAILQAKIDQWLRVVASRSAGRYERLLELLDKMDCPESYDIWVRWHDFLHRLEIASGGHALPNCNGLVLFAEDTIPQHMQRDLWAEIKVKDVTDSMRDLEIAPKEQLKSSMEEFAAQLSETLPRDLAPSSYRHELKPPSYHTMSSGRRDEEIMRLREEIEMLKNNRKSLPGSRAFVQAKVERRMSPVLDLDDEVKNKIAIRRRPLLQEHANEVQEKIFGFGPPGEILVRVFNASM